MKFPLAFLKICGIIIFVAKQKNRLGYRQAVRQQILNLPFRWFESIYPSQKAIRGSGLLLFLANGFDRSGVRKQSSGLFSPRPAFAAAKANPSIRAKKQFAKAGCFYFFASGFDRSIVRKQSSGLFSLRPAFAAAKANPSIRAKKQFTKVDCFCFLQMDSIGAVKGNYSLSISFIVKDGQNFHQNSQGLIIKERDCLH